MKTLHLTVKSGARHFLTAWMLFLPAIEFAAETAKEQPARDPSACELKIEGKHVEKLTLADEQGKLIEIYQPAPSVFLPPGRFQIKEMQVQWADDGLVYTDTDVNNLTLNPSGVCKLIVGTPQTPKLTLTRRGSVLTFDYNLRAANPIYLNATNYAPGISPPQIAIYNKGGQKIASGAFGYG
jgi:hypothetical protein